MGSHQLAIEVIEEGPRAGGVSNLYNAGALGDARHMLLECPALAGLRSQSSLPVQSCSGVMRLLLWAKDQHEVCK